MVKPATKPTGASSTTTAPPQAVVKGFIEILREMRATSETIQRVEAATSTAPAATLTRTNR
jgi:hypothetical protein